MAIKLEGRLKAIADNVPACAAVADIGTDHALIPIYLVSRGICSRAIATDIRKGPIAAANRNISRYGLENAIETRMGFGLAPLSEKEAETIIIAGMGGILISDILREGMPKVFGSANMIIQPMYAAEYLREWLQMKGFEIYDEDLAEEGNKLYNIFKVRTSGISKKTTEIENILGKALIEKKHPLLKKYIQKQIKIYNKISGGLSKARKSSAEAECELHKTNLIIEYLIEMDKSQS